jgi:hypothetical protein
MAEEVTDSAKLAVSFRLGLQITEVWDAGTEARAYSGLKVRYNGYEEALRAQTREAIAEAIKSAEEGLTSSQIARRIRGMVEGRSMYPGVYAEAYKQAKDRGASDAEAERAGDAKARRYRANLIAGTESRTFQNTATLEALDKGGVVRVRVTDGDGCGWRTHEDLDKAHGTKRPLADARRYTLAHPACRRRFYPVTEAPPAEGSGGAQEGGGSGEGV